MDDFQTSGAPKSRTLHACPANDAFDGKGKESNQPLGAWGKRSKWENAIFDCTIKRTVSGILSPNQVPGNKFL